MVTTIIPVLNLSEMTNEIIKNSHFSNLVIIDNGSDKPIKGAKIRNKTNIGVYPTFKQGMNLECDILAFLHNDLIIWDKDWESKVEQTFNEHPKLGLLGFIGSNEIDFMGGRGLGTMSNFQGKRLGKLKGSPAEVHGKRITGYHRAAVIDGCAMIFRKETLQEIGIRDDFPIHHFYDRLMSCQILEKGWQVGVLGLAVDHFSGYTANTQDKYHDLAKQWMNRKYKNIRDWIDKNEDWVYNKYNPSKGKVPINSDQWLYLEAERMFLQEWRDKKHLIPIKI